MSARNYMQERYFCQDGFVWVYADASHNGLMCAPAEDAHDDSAWCDVADFSAEPEVAAKIEQARDSLAAIAFQRGAATLSSITRALLVGDPSGPVGNVVNWQLNSSFLYASARFMAGAM
jgi:hypothetical protein